MRSSNPSPQAADPAPTTGHWQQLTRRVILLQLAAGASAGLAATRVPSEKPGPVNETEASAVSLGYVSESSRADRKRFPSFKPEQKCGNCALYQAKGGASTGPCPLFAGRDVAAAGWCSGWSKKA